MKTTILAAAAAAFCASAACAGDFNDRGGAALGGHDAVAYFLEGRPVAGRVDLRHVYRGSTFLFASAANRDAFAANAEKYAPQYGGYCAYGVARGYKAEIDPASFSIVGGRLFLNYDKQVQRDWLKDPAGYIAKADERWGEVRKTEKVHR